MPSADSPERRIEDLKQRLEQDPRSRAFLQLAEEYRRLGRLDEALGTLRKGLAHQPSYLSARVLAARCLLESGDPEGATAELRQVVLQDPTHALAHKLLVEAHLTAGDRSAARKSLETYNLINGGDPELEDLRRRIEGGAGEAPVRERAPGRPAETPAPVQPVAVRVPPAPRQETTDLFGIELSTAAPAVAATGEDLFGLWERPAAVEPVRGEEPFGELLTGEERHRWATSLEESPLFRLPADGGDPEEPELPAAATMEADQGVDGLELSEQAEGIPPRPAPPVVERPEDLFDLETPVHGEELGAGSQDFLGDVPVAGPAHVQSGEAADFFEPDALELEAEPEPREPEDRRGEARPVDVGVGGEPPWESPRTEKATVTLGRLYLAQGHREEALRIFRAVCEREPENLAARAALEELGASPSSSGVETGSAGPTPSAGSVEIEATTLEGVSAAPPSPPPEPLDEAGLTERKIQVLTHYLRRLRRAAEQHVS
jgi:tetratricopeptide (TPR) repeat protein